MQNQPVSEYRRNMRLRTILLVMLNLAGTIVGVFGIGSAVYGLEVGHGRWLAQVAVFGVLGMIFAGSFGYGVITFIRRMWAVKLIRFSGEGDLEIITSFKTAFKAKLPQDIRYCVVHKDSLTIGLRIGRNRFVIDPLEFSNSAQLNELIGHYASTSKCEWLAAS